MATETTLWILELIDKISAPMRGVEQATNSAKITVDKFQFSSKEAMDAIKSEVPAASKALGMLTNPYVAAAAGAAAVVAGGYKVVSMANDWQEGLAKINVTAQLTKDELSELSDKMLTVGKRSVRDIEEVPEAFNKIISAGLDAREAMAALEPTLKASKGGFTDIFTTATAGVAVMNSSGRDINEVYDTLFATLNKGNAEFSDIANYLPKVIPMAKDAGFALQETAGAWAYLTAQGQTAERATTLAQNAMKAMTDPKRIDAFKQIGINLHDSTGKIKPLTLIIEELSQKTQGLSDLAKAEFFGQLGLDQEAASFFAVASQDVEKFKETIDFAVNSQGQLNEAYKNSLAPMDRWKQMWNMAKGSMIQLGQKALPIIASIGEHVFEAINYVKDLYNNSKYLQDIVSGIGTSFKWAFKIAIIPIKATVNLIKSIYTQGKNLINIFPGIANSAKNFYASVRPVLTYVRELFGSVADIMYKVVTLDFRAAYDAFKNFELPNLDEIKVKIKAEAEAEEKNKSGAIVTGADKKEGVSPKITANTLGGSANMNLKSSGAAAIKSITQHINIKNYFTIADSGQADVEGIAEKVVSVINAKLRDGIAVV